MVLIASPPPLKPPSPLFRSLVAGSFMLRIFDPTRHGTTALSFRLIAGRVGDPTVNILCGLIAYCHQPKKPGISMAHNPICSA